MKTKKGKLCVKVRQVDGIKIIHTWPVKYGEWAGLNLFPLTCKLLHGSKLCRDMKNNIVLDSANGNIVLDQSLRPEMNK